MESVIERARELARTKHAAGHLFDESRSPMFDHISEVASLVEEQGGTDEMIAAAWLHDVVEDTDVTLEQVGEWFGSTVRELVDGLTDPDEFASMPLELRKRAQAERIRHLSDGVKRIKLCDQLSNARRVLDKPPVDWAEDLQWTQIEGARAITLECRGLWPALDERFDAVYAAARLRFLGTSS